jgi:mRNA-degrading endonuclease YafQ of YafQ-DinJ toxin-antitoxin module
MSWILKPSKHFKRDYKKLIKNNRALEGKIDEVLDLLSLNPKDSTLRSHKVRLHYFGEVWSTRVTGDIRILWDHDEDNQQVILLLTIGGHDYVYG